jgi:hypothetical protein
MLRRTHTDITIKWLGDRHPTRNHLAPRIKRLAIYDLLRDVESPDDAADVQIQRFLCNVHSGTYASPCSIGEVVTLIRIRDVEVCGGGEVVA